MSQADDRYAGGARGGRDLRRHERVWDLLPWYVNGTLAASERAAVEDHLAACPRCRQEAESCRHIAAAVGAAEAVAPSPHPVQLARLMSLVEEAEAAAGSQPAAALGATPGGGLTDASRRLRAPRRLGRRLLGALAATPPPVRWALAAQMAFLVLLGGGFAWRQQHDAPPAVYEAQAEPGAASAPARGLQLRIVFGEDASERQIRDLLLRIRGRVTGGPSPLGAYTVEIPAGAGATDPPAVVVAYLRAQPAVRLAEPIAGTGPGGRE